MASHKSSLKRIRQTKVKAERNRFYRTRVKNIIRDVNEAIESGDKDKAAVAMQIANRDLHKFVSKGILKKNTAARRVGRLQVKVNAIA
ncbi:MAG: 30S ribosomal protein S20 [Sulfuricurvum sp. PC08-66]|nr:MAG: 30S ribosomal protein S20 [Sulfuricurvum sp. PC08-66]